MERNKPLNDGRMSSMIVGDDGESYTFLQMTNVASVSGARPTCTMLAWQSEYPRGSSACRRRPGLILPAAALGFSGVRLPALGSPEAARARECTAYLSPNILAQVCLYSARRRIRKVRT